MLSLSSAFSASSILVCVSSHTNAALFFTRARRSCVLAARLGTNFPRYLALFSGLMSNKLGVAILFNNNFSFKILRQLCDKKGRYIIVDLEVGELTLTICNIYAPNIDDTVFFKTVSEQMLSFKCDEIILGGDFNLVLDILKDKKGGKQTTHWNSLKELKSI